MRWQCSIWTCVTSLPASSGPGTTQLISKRSSDARITRSTLTSRRGGRRRIAAAWLAKHRAWKRTDTIGRTARSNGFDGRSCPGVPPKESAGGIVMFYEDITERKMAEAAVRESKELLQLFIDQAPAALAMFDREMRYLAVSRRWLGGIFPCRAERSGAVALRDCSRIFPNGGRTRTSAVLRGKRSSRGGPFPAR